MMDALGKKGLVRVARMFGMEHDPALMGRPFYVMEQLQGQVPVSVTGLLVIGWRSWQAQAVFSVPSRPAASKGFLGGRHNLLLHPSRRFIGPDHYLPAAEGVTGRDDANQMVGARLPHISDDARVGLHGVGEIEHDQREVARVYRCPEGRGPGDDLVGRRGLVTEIPGL